MSDSVFVLVLDLGYDGEVILGVFLTQADAETAADTYIARTRWSSDLAVYTIPVGKLVESDYLTLHRLQIHAIHP
jgi:hypothetical protein